MCVYISSLLILPGSTAAGTILTIRGTSFGETVLIYLISTYTELDAIIHGWLFLVVFRFPFLSRFSLVPTWVSLLLSRLAARSFHNQITR